MRPSDFFLGKTQHPRSRDPLFSDTLLRTHPSGPVTLLRPRSKRAECGRTKPKLVDTISHLIEIKSHFVQFGPKFAEIGPILVQI